MLTQVVEVLDEGMPEHLSVPDQFAVVDEGSANWVVRKIIESRLYVDRVESWAAGEIRRARRDEAWFTQRYGGQVERWVRGELAARGGRSRSVKLPAGQVGFRRVPLTLRTVDTPVLVAWCRENLPDALRLKVNATGQAALSLANLLHATKLEVAAENAVTAAEVQTYVTASGEVPPGVEAIDGHDRFYIREG